MRVAIAGAGAVGRSIALELLENHHQVMLIERELTQIEADWLPELAPHFFAAGGAGAAAAGAARSLPPAAIMDQPAA